MQAAICLALVAALALWLWRWFRRPRMGEESKPAAFKTMVRCQLQWHLGTWVLWPLYTYTHQLSPEDEPRGRRKWSSDRRIANENWQVTPVVATLALQVVYRQEEQKPSPPAQVPHDVKPNKRPK